MPAYITFGSGKLICPGEQLAMDMMFLTVVLLMQSTVGYEIVLAKEPLIMDLDPNRFNGVLEPKHFNIHIKKINV
jgi:cytochrome P450